MSSIKKVVFYSVCLVYSTHFSLRAENFNVDPHEDDLLLIFDDNAEEVHSLEDIDRTVLESDIQNYAHDVEFDPAGLVSNALPAAPQDIVILDHNEEPSTIEQLICMECENIAPYVSDLVTTPYVSLEPVVVIPVYGPEINLAANNGIALAPAQVACEQDDIVLVPHELINSVKKAEKHKKKLEKKAKAQLRKSKKKNKLKS